jgi:hypothetical protein
VLLESLAPLFVLSRFQERCRSTIAWQVRTSSVEYEREKETLTQLNFHLTASENFIRLK